MYDTSPDTDAAATKISTLGGRWTFSKFLPKGLDLSSPHSLEVVIRDDLSGIGTELVFVFEGWTYHYD